MATENGTKSTSLNFANRILETDAPIVGTTRKFMSKNPKAMSLAQGIVFWKPPREAMAKLQEKLITSESIHSYGPGEGLPALREALRTKLKDKNNLQNYDVMVTNGANQGFVNCIVSLTDETDDVVLFKPYYFDHLMTIQMTGGARTIIYGDCDPKTLHPDLDWLQREFEKPKKPKVVVITTPCNPTGIVMTKEELIRVSELCKENNTWLIVDDTYEDFLYDDRKHYCIGDNHIIHIFSFSKVYGMMGWRVGYIAYPNYDGKHAILNELLKVQDTVAVCPMQLSQELALECLKTGMDQVQSLIQDLNRNRECIRNALEPLGDEKIHGGEGAYYFWAKLPDGCDNDEDIVEWLTSKHSVCVIPGSSCGIPGHIRVAFANLPYDKTKLAAANLKKGLQELVENGPDAIMH